MKNLILVFKKDWEISKSTMHKIYFTSRFLPSFYYDGASLKSAIYFN